MHLQILILACQSLIFSKHEVTSKNSGKSSSKSTLVQQNAINSNTTQLEECKIPQL